jgi:hypothetical protein
MNPYTYCSSGGTFFCANGGGIFGRKLTHQNVFTHANHPVRTIVGAITTLIDIRIGLFLKERELMVEE